MEKDTFVTEIERRDLALAPGSETTLLGDFRESFEKDPSPENAEWWEVAYDLWESVGGEDDETYQFLVYESPSVRQIRSRLAA